jgi:hypothetical protein
MTRAYFRLSTVGLAVLHFLGVAVPAVYAKGADSSNGFATSEVAEEEEEEAS